MSGVATSTSTPSSAQLAKSADEQRAVAVLQQRMDRGAQPERRRRPGRREQLARPARGVSARQPAPGVVAEHAGRDEARRPAARSGRACATRGRASATTPESARRTAAFARAAPLVR